MREEQSGSNDGLTALGAGAGGELARLALLDFMRGIALLRVVAFHVTGIDGLTMIASMPVMFFVAGALFSRSMHSRPGPVVTKDRYRRILPSLAAYATVLLVGFWAGGMLTGSWSDVVRPDGTIEKLGIYHSLALYVPVISVNPPVGPGTPADPVFWLWNPLWYLHVHLALAVFGVLLVWAYRRWPVPTLAVGGLWWLVVTVGDRGYGNTPTFCLMFLLGFTFTDGRLLAISRATLIRLTVAAGVLGLAFLPFGPGLEINQWAPTLFGVGFVWIGLALVWREPLERLAAGPVFRPLIHFLSRRALTIYLWHLVGVYVSRHLFPPEGGLLQLVGTAVVSLLITAVVTLLACTAFGWIEDLAARRKPEIWPTGLVAGRVAR